MRTCSSVTKPRFMINRCAATAQPSDAAWGRIWSMHWSQSSSRCFWWSSLAWWLSPTSVMFAHELETSPLIPSLVHRRVRKNLNHARPIVIFFTCCSSRLSSSLFFVFLKQSRSFTSHSNRSVVDLHWKMRSRPFCTILKFFSLSSPAECRSISIRSRVELSSAKHWWT